ncbi:5-carboxymethyl-2-hydroxymuconate isomerase [Afipia massiliensis]|uniref:5-carboxymethyl-2-hydroxymuconate isomerase n=1 Tax=Afipia massiliensis TaxID=211460 RepID=A0A840N5B2_9BRAD|nr:5-carboxymethyl-2-hydroxymuconate isomerase [Afipia massiliensis]MBB5054072.1 5-carboxymethyl-2-hydroxymuconate isomerase [Afipia massiliensis]
MPHLVCHYSTSPDMPPMQDVMLALHRAAASTGVVQAEDLKIRAQPFTDYLVAGEQRSFFHLSLYLLAGRTPEQKEHLSTELRKALAGLLIRVHSISVDIRDMDPQAYKKRLLDS